MFWMAELSVVPQKAQTRRGHLTLCRKTCADRKSTPNLFAIAMLRRSHRHNKPPYSPCHSHLLLYSVHLPVQNIALAARLDSTFRYCVFWFVDRHRQFCHALALEQTVLAIDTVDERNNRQRVHPFPFQYEHQVHACNPHRVEIAKSRNPGRRNKRWRTIQQYRLVEMALIHQDKSRPNLRWASKEKMSILGSLLSCSLATNKGVTLERNSALDSTTTTRMKIAAFLRVTGKKIRFFSSSFGGWALMDSPPSFAALKDLVLRASILVNY